MPRASEPAKSRRTSASSPASICGLIALRWQTVTIHHLLTHISGIPDYTAMPGFWEGVLQRRVSAEELIALVADQPLTGAPGAQFAYSNTGYVVLGTIIARVANPTRPALGAEKMVVVLSNNETTPVVAIGRELAAVLIRHAKDGATGQPT